MKRKKAAFNKGALYALAMFLLLFLWLLYGDRFGQIPLWVLGVGVGLVALLLITLSDSYSVEQTVAAFRFRGRAFPAFEVSPRGMIAKVAAIAGAHGITFESHPEFSKHFQLRGDDLLSAASASGAPLRVAESSSGGRGKLEDTR